MDAAGEAGWRVDSAGLLLGLLFFFEGAVTWNAIALLNAALFIVIGDIVELGRVFLRRRDRCSSDP